jgi:hypothetical protein
MENSNRPCASRQATAGLAAFSSPDRAAKCKALTQLEACAAWPAGRPPGSADGLSLRRGRGQGQRREGWMEVVTRELVSTKS